MQASNICAFSNQTHVIYKTKGLDHVLCMALCVVIADVTHTHPQEAWLQTTLTALVSTITCMGNECMEDGRCVPAIGTACKARGMMAAYSHKRPQAERQTVQATACRIITWAITDLQVFNSIYNELTCICKCGQTAALLCCIMCTSSGFGIVATAQFTFLQHVADMS